MNFKKIIGYFFLVCLAGAVIGFTGFLYFYLTLPKIDSLADYNPSIPSQILASDGEVLFEYGTEKREITPFKEIPKVIVDAFLSAEDNNFYDHAGVDYIGLARAMLKNIKAGRVVQGGSTITQQVAKSLLLSSERSISRKIRDFLLAQKIEKKFSKEDILFLYLNQVYLGGGYYGVKAAIRGYFDKELDEASIAESALIAGLLVAPGRYSPYLRPKYAKQRQNYVLKRMFETGKISNKEYTKALKEKIRLKKREPYSAFKAGHFTDLIRQVMIEAIGEQEFLGGGYKVQTTLNWSMQQTAQLAIDNGLAEIDKRQGYKGPIKNIKEDEYEKMELELRKKIYKKASKYFYFKPDGTNEDEIIYSEDNYATFKEEQEEKEKQVKLKHFKAGYSSADKTVELLEKNELYDAIVLDVNNPQRLIYVSVAGVRGVIDYEGFRWAHERKIIKDRNYYSYVTRPTDIVKKGDIVKVKVKYFKQNFSRVVNDNYYAKLQNKKLKAALSKEKYVLFTLEQEVDVEGALVCLETGTGNLVSIIGGKDFSKSQFNRAIQSLRQPGSSFKPILYAIGLEKKYTPSSILLDTPESLGGVNQELNWKPRNYDNKFKGEITFRKSLEQSRNVPTIKLAAELGVPYIFDHLDRIRFNAKIPADLSMSLGSFGVTLLDLVKSYGLYPNGGKLIRVKMLEKVVDRHGNEMPLDKFIPSISKYLKRDPLVTTEVEEEKEEEKTEETKEEVVKNEDGTEAPAEDEKPINPFLEELDAEQVYDKKLSYIMTNLLRGIIQNGTGRRAKGLSPFIGGKTGTTNDYVDAWFIGFSQRIALGVWTGFDNNDTMGWGETGAKSALPIWIDVMRKGLEIYGEEDFRVPKGIINVKINSETGNLASSNDKKVHMEAYVEGTEPGNQTLFKKEDQGEVVDSENSSIFEDDDYYNN